VPFKAPRGYSIFIRSEIRLLRKIISVIFHHVIYTSMKVISINDVIKRENHDNTENRICYIIMTCDKYLSTRVKWQLETCFENFNRKDLYYLSYKNGPDPWIYGFNTGDGQDQVSYKYLGFYKNLSLDYDFYVFIDDDTFVFPERIQNWLKYIDKNHAYYMGNMCEGSLGNMHGGAGFILTNPVYILLKSLLKNTDTSTKLWKNGDTQTALWIKHINKVQANPITHISDKEFFNITIKGDLLKSGTFHYLKEQSDYIFFHNLRKK